MKWFFFLIITLLFGACNTNKTLTKDELALNSGNHCGLYTFEDNQIVLPHFTDSGKTYSLKKQPTLTFKYLKKLKKTHDQEGAVIIMTFNSEGSDKLKKVTAENIHKYLAIVIDGLVISAPRVIMPVKGGTLQISGLTDEEADFILNKMSK